MYIRFTFIHRLLATLVITSLLLVPNSSVFATTNVVHTMNTLFFDQPGPPPLGPPAPRDPIQNMSIPLALTGSLKITIDDAVKEINQKNAQATSGVRVKVSWRFYAVHGP